MSSMNKVMLLGRLGKKPEIRKTQTGKNVCNLNLATSQKMKDQNGIAQEKTDWHQIIVWGPQAENCAKYLDRGSQVLVEGRIQTREVINGQMKEYKTEIIAENVMFLSKPIETRTPQNANDLDNIPF